MKPKTQIDATRAADMFLIAVIVGCWIADIRPPSWLLYGTFVWAVVVGVLSLMGVSYDILMQRYKAKETP